MPQPDESKEGLLSYPGGFQITFPNLVSVEVRFGQFSYSENFSIQNPKDGLLISSNAEIAIHTPDGRFITRRFKDNDDDVLPRQSVEEVWEALKWAHDLLP